MNFVIAGCGNMARALFTQKIKDSDFSFWTYSPTGESAKSLAQKIGAQVANTPTQLSPEVDVLFVACKPQQFSDLAQQWKHLEIKNIVSVMAAITIEQIQKALNCINVIRMMPNTPCQVGLGVNLYCKSDQFPKEMEHKILKIFNQRAQSYLLEQQTQMDLLTPLLGSGPAYIFELARIFSLYLVDHGIDGEKADSMVKQLLIGSAALLKQSSLSAKELRDQVTSKGGITEKALESLELDGLAMIYNRAFKAGHLRGIQMSKEKI